MHYPTASKRFRGVRWQKTKERWKANFKEN